MADNLHGVLVAIGADGVLITGPARSGKSSLGLCLLRLAAREGKQAALVADDQVLLHVRDGVPWGAAPHPLRGLMEISGAGIVRLAWQEAAPIRLVASLSDNPPRLPPEGDHGLVAGIAVGRIHLPRLAASLSAEIVLTVLAGDGLARPHIHVMP